MSNLFLIKNMFKKFQLEDEYLNKLKERLKGNKERLFLIERIISQDKAIYDLINNNYSLIINKFEEVSELINKIEEYIMNLVNFVKNNKKTKENTGNSEDFIGNPEKNEENTSKNQENNWKHRQINQDNQDNHQEEDKRKVLNKNNKRSLILINNLISKNESLITNLNQKISEKKKEIQEKLEKMSKDHQFTSKIINEKEDYKKRLNISSFDFFFNKETQEEYQKKLFSFIKSNSNQEKYQNPTDFNVNPTNLIEDLSKIDFKESNYDKLKEYNIYIEGIRLDSEIKHSKIPEYHSSFLLLIKIIKNCLLIEMGNKKIEESKGKVNELRRCIENTHREIEGVKNKIEFFNKVKYRIMKGFNGFNEEEKEGKEEKENEMEIKSNLFNSYTYNNIYEENTMNNPNYKEEIINKINNEQGKVYDDYDEEEEEAEKYEEEVNKSEEVVEFFDKLKFLHNKIESNYANFIKSIIKALITPKEMITIINESNK